MARPKLKYKNKAEQLAALDHARAQYERALEPISNQSYWNAMYNRSMSYTPYRKSPRTGRYRIADTRTKSFQDLESNAVSWATYFRDTRKRQLDAAYANRVNAIQQAGITG